MILERIHADLAERRRRGEQDLPVVHLARRPGGELWAARWADGRVIVLWDGPRFEEALSVALRTTDGTR